MMNVGKKMFVSKLCALAILFSTFWFYQRFIPVSAASAVLPDGWYAICTGNDGNYCYVLNIEGGSMDDGGNLIIYPWENTDNEWFYLHHIGNGVYTIRVMRSGKYLHISDHGSANVNVHQWGIEDHLNAYWVLEDAGDGYFYVRNVHNNAYLDNAGGVVANCNNVQTYWGNQTPAQKWLFVLLREEKTVNKYYTVTAKSGLNVRTGPGTSYGKVTAIGYGKEVRFIEDANNGWYKISYNGTEGYCSANYLKFSREEEVTAQGNNTGNAYYNAMMDYIRNAPGSSAKEWGGGSGTQCVELPKHFIDVVFGCDSHYLGLGNGNTLYSGIASQYPDKFTAIKYYDGFRPEVGDIISLYGSQKQYGHAAVVISVNGDKYTIIEQWKGSGTVRTRELTVTGSSSSKNGIIGVARPKLIR